MSDCRRRAAKFTSGKGWEEVTEAAIRALNARTDADGKPKPLVAILWGRNAQSLEPLLTNAFIIKSPHPSPLSASRGFFGSKPFSRANQALVTMGADPVDWTSLGRPTVIVSSLQWGA